MSKSRLKENKQEKRIPAPKLRREPLPMSISVKHHLPIGVEGTATDLTVAELEKVSPPLPPSPPLPLPLTTQLDYSTSQVKSFSKNTSSTLKNKQEPSYIKLNEERLEKAKFASRIDQILDLDFSSDHSDQDLDLNDHDHLFNSADRDHNYDHDLDQDLDDRDHSYFDDHDHNIPQYPLFEERVTSATNKTQNKSTHQTLKKKTDRSINQLDLNIQSKYVRVPNLVADQLARQLSPAEEKIFDQIWRLTVGFNRDIWRGKISDLMIRTGYSSRATVTKAIAGLSALGLIRIEGRDTNPRGRSYRIVDKVKLGGDQEINDQAFQNDRKLSSQKLDQTKNSDHAKLVKQTSSQAKTIDSTKKSSTTHANSNQLVEQEANKAHSKTTENKQLPSLKQSSSQAFKNTFRKKDDLGYSPSSSREDDENFSQVRLIYQDLSGNYWTPKDDSSYKEIAKIPIPYIILGICYSITRASDHKISSLKYCVPSICEHYELMRTFPYKDLLEIAYRHLVLVKDAQRTRRWS